MEGEELTVLGEKMRESSSFFFHFNTYAISLSSQAFYTPPNKLQKITTHAYYALTWPASLRIISMCFLFQVNPMTHQ